MDERLIDKTCELINQILDEGIDMNNLEPLYKLTKIKHMVKEDMENMTYGNYYGRYPEHDYYGRMEYNNYGRRERDSRGRYRGHEHLDRMYDQYGRYEEDRQRYGASEDTKRSLKYMLESMEDFARMLREDAQSQEEIEMIRQTAQRIAQM